MVQNHKSKHHQNKFRFQFYLIFLKYYRNQLFDKSIWPNVTTLLTDNIVSKDNHFIKIGLSLINDVDEESVNNAIFDFNRLFVGPGKILAPTYESYYRNTEKLPMQRETLQVRRFYEMVGLQVDDLGREPDDHIEHELEFVCYLLNNNNEELYYDFFESHLGKWILNHIYLVLENSKTDICKGMAYIFKGFIELEKEELKYTRGGVTVE